jgi:hypothetical protein
MSIKIQRVLNVGMVLLAWLMLPCLGKQNIKRFLPAALLITVIEGISANIGKRRRWWVTYNKPNSYLFSEFPFNIGPFLVGSMWILKWTYGRFIPFILLNAAVNAFFAFPFTIFARKVRYYTLVRFNHLQFFIYFFSKAFLFYWIQSLFEKNKVTPQV